jgi:hypothetical protein
VTRELGSTWKADIQPHRTEVSCSIEVIVSSISGGRSTPRASSFQGRTRTVRSYQGGYNDTASQITPAIVQATPKAQRAEAFRMSYGIVPSDQDNGPEYIVTKVGCYLYAKNDAASHCWRLCEIVQEWPNTTLEEPSLERYTDPPAVASLPYTMIDCSERQA